MTPNHGCRAAFPRAGNERRMSGGVPGEQPAATGNVHKTPPMLSLIKRSGDGAQPHATLSEKPGKGHGKRRTAVNGRVREEKGAIRRGCAARRTGEGRKPRPYGDSRKAQVKTPGAGIPEKNGQGHARRRPHTNTERRRAWKSPEPPGVRPGLVRSPGEARRQRLLWHYQLTGNCDYCRTTCFSSLARCGNAAFAASGGIPKQLSR